MNKPIFLIKNKSNNKTYKIRKFPLYKMEYTTPNIKILGIPLSYKKEKEYYLSKTEPFFDYNNYNLSIITNVAYGITPFNFTYKNRNPLEYKNIYKLELNMGYFNQQHIYLQSYYTLNNQEILFDYVPFEITNDWFIYIVCYSDDFFNDFFNGELSEYFSNINKIGVAKIID